MLEMTTNDIRILNYCINRINEEIENISRQFDNIFDILNDEEKTNILCLLDVIDIISIDEIEENSINSKVYYYVMLIRNLENERCKNYISYIRHQDLKNFNKSMHDPIDIKYYCTLKYGIYEYLHITTSLHFPYQLLIYHDRIEKEII